MDRANPGLEGATPLALEVLCPPIHHVVSLDSGVPRFPQHRGDADVDTGDYALFRKAYGRGVGESFFIACCDYDHSGTIGLSDYQAWLACYRDFVGNPLAGPQPLPLPAPNPTPGPGPTPGAMPVHADQAVAPAVEQSDRRGRR